MLTLRRRRGVLGSPPLDAFNSLQLVFGVRFGEESELRQ
jgi:hypothetical protein